jgi:hypothetical protein
VNYAASDYATVGGGLGSWVLENAGFGVVGGGLQNMLQAGSHSATIGGGGINSIGPFGFEGTIGGGAANIIHELAFRSTIGGGTFNEILTNASNSTIGGGEENVINDNSEGATIAGGSHNTVGGEYATVAGGRTNSAFGHYSTVGGGAENINFGNYGTIPGGRFNTAADYAFAAGRRARATFQGSFVWADSQDADFGSTTVNQFNVRAGGGFRLFGGNHWNVNTTEGDFRIGNVPYRLKIGVALDGGGAGDVWMRAHGGTQRLFVKTPGGTTFFSDEAQSTGVSLAPGGGAFIGFSDRNAKENFQPVDALEVLEKVARLPVTTWNYKSQAPSIRHLGPVAQDFKAAFAVGESETGITSTDADGVALAAIQGLNQKLEEGMQKSEIHRRELEERLGQREQEIEVLKARLALLEARFHHADHD